MDYMTLEESSKWIDDNMGKTLEWVSVYDNVYRVKVIEKVNSTFFKGLDLDRFEYGSWAVANGFGPSTGGYWRRCYTDEDFMKDIEQL